MKKQLTTSQNDILRFAEMHGQYTVWGVVMVLAARDLVQRGMIEIISDEANEDGIGHVTVQHKVAAA